MSNDVDGVESREAALLMRSHRLQSLGDACLTDGLNPGEKYRAPVLDSHEYGWRVPMKGNGGLSPTKTPLPRSCRGPCFADAIATLAARVLTIACALIREWQACPTSRCLAWQSTGSRVWSRSSTERCAAATLRSLVGSQLRVHLRLCEGGMERENRHVLRSPLGDAEDDNTYVRLWGILVR